MIKIHDKQFKPFILQDEISQKITSLAQKLDEQFVSERPVFIVVLNGAFMFAADLVRELETTVELHFVKVSSYRGTESSGQITYDLEINADLKGREVYIIEDIVETGTTLDFLKDLCLNKNVKSYKVVSLLYKSKASENVEDPDFYCFDIANDFVVGYGLDYDQLGRQLKDVWVLSE